MYRVVGYIRPLHRHTGPASAFYRMLIPTVVLLPTLGTDRKRERLSGHKWGIIALGGLFFALDLALYNTPIAIEF